MQGSYTFVSLNSRLESNNEEEDEAGTGPFRRPAGRFSPRGSRYSCPERTRSATKLAIIKDKLTDLHENCLLQNDLMNNFREISLQHGGDGTIPSAGGAEAFWVLPAWIEM